MLFGMDHNVAVRAVNHGTAEYYTAVALRRRILRAPLGFDFEPAELEAEVGDIHLIAERLGSVVACAVLTWVGHGTLKLRQMAVDEHCQGQGIGRAVVEAAEVEAEDQGADRLMLHARRTALGFYELMGYVVDGEEFSEVTIPHRCMVKVLRRAA